MDRVLGIVIIMTVLHIIGYREQIFRCFHFSRADSVWLPPVLMMVVKGEVLCLLSTLIIPELSHFLNPRIISFSIPLHNFLIFF